MLADIVLLRLANLDHNLTVLLIEGGENNLNNPWVFRPGIFPRNMKLDSKTATFYESRPSKWLGGRKAIVPCANILGGGSSINFMVSFDTRSEQHLRHVLIIHIRCIRGRLLPTTMTSRRRDGRPRT